MKFQQHVKYDIKINNISSFHTNIVHRRQVRGGFSIESLFFS